MNLLLIAEIAGPQGVQCACKTASQTRQLADSQLADKTTR